MNGLKNAASTIPPSDFIRIQLQTSDNKKIDQALNVNAFPTLSAGPLKNIVISRNSNLVGASVTYTVRFDTTYDVGNENGTYFFMSLPAGMVY